MRDAEKTIGNMIDKQSICHISSVDKDGFPNTKVMLKPRKRNGIKENCVLKFTSISARYYSNFKSEDI